MSQSATTQSEASSAPPQPSHARRTSRSSVARWLLLAIPLTLLALFFAYPLWRTLAMAFTGDGSAWTWVATHPYVRARLAGALLQATLSVALTLLLAIPLAWMYHTRALRWGRWHLALHAAPFVLPVFVVVFGIQQLLGRGGWVHELTGVDLLTRLGPMGAVVIAHAYYNYGFAARLLHTILDRRPRALEAAARTLGATRVGAFLRVSLPLLLPSFLAVTLLVFLFCFTSFGVILYMGESRVSTLETLLFQNMGGAFPRYDRAAVLGILQLGLNAAMLLAYFLLRKRESRIPGAPASRLRSKAGPAISAIAWGGLALALSPALAVLVGGFRVRGTWTLEAWRALLDQAHPQHLSGFTVAGAVARSLEYAAWTVAASLVLTLLLAYGIRRSGRGRRLIEAFATLPLGTSSLLVGFGYVLAFGAGAALDLRGTRFVIVAAHVLMAFPFVARALMPALDQLDRRLDEAASLLGASEWHVAWRVHLPLLRAPLAVAAGLAAAMSLGDFGASLVLMAQEDASLSVWIQRHGGFNPFDPLARAQAVALSSVLMLLAVAAFMVAERFRSPGREEL